MTRQVPKIEPDFTVCLLQFDEKLSLTWFLTTPPSLFSRPDTPGSLLKLPVAPEAEGADGELARPYCPGSRLRMKLKIINTMIEEMTSFGYD